MWVYSQKTGNLYDASLRRVGTGYSGTGEGRNNPAMQDTKNVGPLPCGLYEIQEAQDDPHMGPLVMFLDPDDANEMFGRSAFYIHGDDAEHDASEGCMIFANAIRTLVNNSDDKSLVVVPELIVADSVPWQTT